MHISSTDFVNEGRILYPIGKISAASAWHAGPVDASQGDWRAVALQELIRRAEDVDADAIIDVNYVTDGIAPADESGVSLRRVLATGTAVRLADLA
ncbi:heavy metal-binding domain-containing protein [Methylocella silvestris]|uniref:Uncharacterized protein n=2 Tax=Methylocella silvestris TaxID=199596 RepID=B8EI38_METSB|nr:heavy metal-binding domain-containing protein [Methylocella silvestris]ACK50520.1 protein of unknown function DUF74 [Methylocella silvestris BL2]PNG24593.1 hypothetical protein CR492_17795 [Methylocella silvestris]